MSKNSERPSIEDFWLSLGMITGMLTRDDVQFDLSGRCHQDARMRAYVRLLADKLEAILCAAPKGDR